MDWISVKDKLPPVEKKVLILADRNGFKIITTAIYEDGKLTTEDSMWVWETDGLTYDEDRDSYIVPEGWLEDKVYNPVDVYNYPIDDVVTHWMPLPEPPKEE
jgi:hypothetical protein